MDIKQLQYFIEIINCDFNVSQASKKLNISQPALSAAVKNFEVENGMALFERYKGRLVKLTPAGDVFYNNALNLLEDYHNMMSELREGSLKLKGKVRIGIPPLVLGIAFFRSIPKVILDNPNIEFEIIEAGAHELRKRLLARELDFAILLHNQNTDTILDEYLLLENKLDAFVNADSPLLQQLNKAGQLSWSALDAKPMVTFDDSFMIRHHLQEKFAEQGVALHVSLTSGSWDFLLMAVSGADVFTVLPAPVGEVVKLTNIVQVPFDDPIPWRVSICRPKKSHYNHLETHVLNAILTEMSGEVKKESVL